MKKNNDNEIMALKVNQWLNEWEKVDYNEEFRKKPEERFYLFSLSAEKLRRLSGIHRREDGGRKQETINTNIQRRHEPKRSQNIHQYIKYGFPWSDLSETQRKNEKFNDLRKPGWLPTAIVLNILKEDDKRDDKKVEKKDLITVRETDNNLISIILPEDSHKKNWKPTSLTPIEIIDGQHRLWAFDKDPLDENYELPVVAFYGLDLSWQAYLFYTINIKPKRINPSMAYDLYPLLRTEDWLDKFEGHKIYRETRAQEITQTLWSDPKSVWYHRINMLGDSGVSQITQSSWIRALLKTFIKVHEGKGVKLGGLFGAPVGEDKIVIPWKRNQQAAFVIKIWNEMEKEVSKCKYKWAKRLRDFKYKKEIKGDAAFYGPHTLLNNDQGITVVLNIANDLFYKKAKDLNLKGWVYEDSEKKDVLSSFEENKKIIKFMKDITKSLVKFDWISSGFEKLSDKEKTEKLVFRGGSGYKEFRKQILKHLMKESGDLKKYSREIYKDLKY